MQSIHPTSDLPVSFGKASTAENIFILQKKSIRILAGVILKEHSRPLFIEYNIIPLPSLYIHYSLSESINRIKTTLLILLFTVILQGQTSKSPGKVC